MHIDCLPNPIKIFEQVNYFDLMNNCVWKSVIYNENSRIILKCKNLKKFLTKTHWKNIENQNYT